MTYDAALAKARWAELERQDDLDWDLDAITDRSEAIDFLRRFENRLCIYSSYVEKLYSNYSFVIPESQEGGITILPNEQAWFDTFHDIPADAVEPTGIHILPGETMGHSGLYLKIPGEHRLVGSAELPFQDGLKLLIRRYRMRDEPFLPVLVKGDLREYEARMPSLHLHRLNSAKLQTQSRLNLEAIKGAIAEHLIGLFRHG
ncbi:hypothetical protein M8R19_11620 [Pseudomonas sp. R3.Fl]|uniref:hypothetical protein n=1 Tax=unclassified Pseudomonas TaxID=196821 RepID=UPI000730667E|nr:MULTISPECIES: hypothetical protein [unclassified Pseudomonas]KSW26078.1 hypothetical protein AOX63_20740 [Pseudomonas sp. ADP]MCL6689356.1 hypothetical protein [Pseudomonas sp. R3.Fl]OBP10770.1 hypothetical protein BAE52_12185 [Pseudomonas sp. EGD-AKN5]QOF82705.1 hypothetical protein IG194_19205 [Pseudomonas sp. ADPe]